MRAERAVAFTDLREFIAHLDKHGQVMRVAAPVSRDLEIAEITDRVSKGPPDRNVALLFESVRGFGMPVLINAFGAPGRMAAALGVERLDDLAGRVAKLLDLKMPGSFFDKLRKVGDLFDLAKAGPKHVRSAPCQEVVESDHPSLAALPILQCWPRDAGRYITLPMVFTRDPVTGARNVGMYRLQVFDDRTLGMHWQTHKGSAEHHRLAEEARKPMDVAIALGGDPCSIYAASAPLPPGIDEMVFAGWLRGSGVPMVSGKTVDLDVPAEAEIVLEGWVDPAERRLEGPFGDHTGYYSLAREYPVFHLRAITRRRNPIYPTVIVSIKKRYPGHARKVMYALWGLGLMMLAKTIVVVSEHVDVHDLSEVAWRVTGNIDPKRDLVLVEGPMDDLDHAALRHRFGGKLGIDATEKTDTDGIGQPWPEEIVMSEEIRTLVSRRWAEYGL